MQIPVLYHNEAFLVCVKPVGVLSEESGMPELFREQYGGSCYCVHRLDRNVGGLMVYGYSREAAARLSAAIAEGRTEKEYLAVVEGRPDPESGTMTDLLYHDAAANKSYIVKRERRGVKRASLSYRTLETVDTEQGTLSLVRIRLHTGRSHQIRVQFASRKLPLAGDRRYGASSGRCSIALWSASLRFPDPVSGEERAFESSPPAKEVPWNIFSACLSGKGESLEY